MGEEHRDHVTRWWIEVFGGPAEYSRNLGGYERMVAHHRDLGITGAQRFRFASLMSLAADDAGIPADPEFRAALVGYLEWGTRLAQANSQPGRRGRRARTGAALGVGRGASVLTATRQVGELTLVGLLARSPEAANGFAFILMFLPCASSAFVPIATMPSWLQGFSEHQPITPIIESVRGLLNGRPVGTAPWPARAWCGGILGVPVARSGLAFRWRPG